MKGTVMTRVLATILMFNTALLGFPVTAMGAPITTQTMLQLEERQMRIDHVQDMLMRQDVQQSLIELGVAPADAKQRVAALTDEELATLEHHLGQLPAGGDVLAVIGIVFVILIILDLVGVTDVFSGISKVVR